MYEGVRPVAVYWDLYCFSVLSRVAVNKLVHALIFESFRSFGEEEASSIHAARIKPFAVSPPFRAGRSGKRYSYYDKVPSGWVQVRVTFARPREALALAALACSPDQEIQKVEGGVVRLSHFSTGEAWTPEAAEAFLGCDARMEFLSPVVFRNGRGTRCLPDAALLVRSLADRAAGFGLPMIRSVLEEEGVLSRIAVRDVFLRTHDFPLWGGVRVQGAVGRMTLCLDDACSERGRRAWAVLMSLALYLGVGYKTGFGAGQVAVEPV